MDRKIVSFEALPKLALAIKEQGKQLVTTNGCFDLLHLGHIQYLAEAKALGDILLVGINNDASVKRLKGPKRPIHCEGVRARQVAALECVDYVVIFEQDTPEEFLRLVRPMFHVKGGDYRVEDLPERQVVEEGGGEVRVVSLIPGFSTTALLLKLLADEETRPQGQVEQIDLGAEGQRQLDLGSEKGM